MSGCGDKLVRRTIKEFTIAGVVPTIPPSDDHHDGSWVYTDIYEGELCFNSADGTYFTRSGSSIFTIPATLGITKRYKALLTQSSTGAPTVQILENTLGAVVWSYVAPGRYDATLSGAFLVNKTASDVDNILGYYTEFSRQSANVCRLFIDDQTNTGVDDILAGNTSVEIIVFG